MAYGSVIVSALTALNSCLLAIISYLKLDAKAESYRVSAYKFDKLQTRCEFFSGRLMFTEKLNDTENQPAEGHKDNMQTFLENLEKDIEEIKELNQFVLPQHVRRLFPRLHTTNVFSELKLRGNAQRVYVYDLNAIYNQLAELSLKEPKDEAKILELHTKRDELVVNIIKVRDSYLVIDHEFTNEINASMYRYTIWDMLCCRKRVNPNDPDAKAQYEKDLNDYLKKKVAGTSPKI
jgi:hypothetical protein